MIMPKLLIAVAIGGLITCQALGAEYLLNRDISGNNLFGYVLLTSMLISFVSFLEGYFRK